ncbi:uncharacterized protein F4822DRAFT_150180 [Hypoxylon trugodes]|uniref:uncharacterized protein n=1 Tax=Hypoxylon trugodes TaxID=326681 RepID=UPI00218CD3D9|nr:uncharacterized protein F4822DRAFT_150180 [Hypoxylon trugodes]KAI1393089.1 hypothetical protein F4822DRAFT_150180 [Hypoxylon trugodes]
MILVATSHPFIRAGKGTIQRAASIAQYATEIDNLYASADIILGVDTDGGEMPDALPSDFGNVQMVEQTIRSTVSTITRWSEADMTDSFFDRGMDSLQALRLTRAMRKSLDHPSLSLFTIYQNPTAAQLATALTTTSSAAPSDEHTIARQFLGTYQGLIQQIPERGVMSTGPEEEPNNMVNILLTGSTGTLGTSILYALLDRPNVGHVYCLNRATDGGLEAQHKRFVAAGLDTIVLGSHVTFLQADRAAPGLGLEASAYDELCTRVACQLQPRSPGFPAAASWYREPFQICSESQQPGNPYNVYIEYQHCSKYKCRSSEGNHVG